MCVTCINSFNSLFSLEKTTNYFAKTILKLENRKRTIKNVEGREVSRVFNTPRARKKLLIVLLSKNAFLRASQTIPRQKTLKCSSYTTRKNLTKRQKKVEAKNTAQYYYCPIFLSDFFGSSNF